MRSPLSWDLSWCSSKLSKKHFDLIEYIIITLLYIEYITRTLFSGFILFAGLPLTVDCNIRNGDG